MIFQVIFSIVLVVHGLIHLSGFLRKLKIPDAQPPGKDHAWGSGSKTGRMLWLLCCIGMIGSGIAFLLEMKWWWIVGGTSVMISQLLIIRNWRDAKYGTLVNFIVVIVLLFSYHRQKFDTLVEHETRTLMASQVKTDTSRITHESIVNLPNAVQRWLIKSGAMGKKKVQTVHLKQRGMMRTKPGGKWVSLEAEQYITTNEPGFVWNGLMKTSFLMLNGRDKFMNGKGNMLIKVMATIPVDNSTGKEIDQGAMMRFLAEIVWVPTAALNPYIHWEPINDMTARATMTYQDQTVSGVFYFDKTGDISRFEGQRFGSFEGKFSLETCRSKYWDIKNFKASGSPMNSRSHGN